MWSIVEGEPARADLMEISARIETLRIFLILGIVAVHIPHDDATSPYGEYPGLFDWFMVFLQDGAFRAGVPCLSVISGYLLFRSGTDFNYLTLLKSKFRTVVIPFLIFNIILLPVVFIAQELGFAKLAFPAIADASLRTMLNLLFAFSDKPLNFSLYFLRDLIVCFIMAPIIGLFVKRAPIPTLIVLACVAALSINLRIFLRADILFSFSLGAAIAIHHLNPKCLDRYAPLLMVSFLVLMALLTTSGLVPYLPEHRPMSVVIAGKLLNFVGIAAFWSMSSLILRSPLGNQIAQAGRYSFWIFCCHAPVLLACFMIWLRIGLPADAYPIFFVLAFCVAVSILVVAYQILDMTCPALLQLLTGKRAKNWRSAPIFGGAM